MIYIPHNIPNVDKGYGLAEGAELKTVVALFDPFGRSVTGPSQASGPSPHCEMEGMLAKRALGRAMIRSTKDGNEQDGALPPCPPHTY
jgi:hypothetical protein